MIRRLFYKKRKFFDDDFDWDNYTADSYHRRLKGDVETNYRTISKAGQLQFDAATGVVTSIGDPIHPNQHLILEAIGQLAPESVHEVGCGAGDYLANAATLFPDLTVTGGDRGTTQLDLALHRHPQLAGKVGVQDITMPFSRHWPRADLVFTKAVIMHIHTAVSHFVALTNLVRSARKYVLLAENQQCHNFVRDILALHEAGHFEWDDLHLYQFDASTGSPGILLSREELDLPPLTSDAQIRANVKPSLRRLRRSDDDSARALFGFSKSG